MELVLTDHDICHFYANLICKTPHDYALKKSIYIVCILALFPSSYTYNQHSLQAVPQ